jgi:transcriptional regulator with XRE-family HTH domain
MKSYRPARSRAAVSVGESVRVVRELQGLSQNQLAQLTGISQATISAIENDRVRLGVERTKALALALKCHPGVLCSPAGNCQPKRRHDIWARSAFVNRSTVRPDPPRCAKKKGPRTHRRGSRARVLSLEF